MTRVTRKRKLRGRSPKFAGAVALVLVLSACATTGKKPEVVDATIISRVIALGDEAARRGDFERALTHYLRAVSLEETVEAWFRVGAASSEIGKSEGALLAYSKVLEMDPLDAEAYEGAGLEHMVLGNAEAARRHLTRSVELDPSRWRSRNALGILADQAQDYAAALDHYEAAIAINPESPMLRNNIGFSRYLSGDLDQAARDFYDATRLQPDYKAAWTNLGIVYAERRWYFDAVSILSRVMAKARAYNDVGHVAYRNGDFVESEQLLAEAVSSSPSYYPDAQRNLELVRSRLRDGAQDTSVSRAPLIGLSETLVELARGDER